MEGKVALFSFDVIVGFAHCHELVDKVFVVVVDLFDDELLGTEYGREEGELSGGGVFKRGGVGDPVDNGGEGGVDKFVQGGSGRNDVLKLGRSFVVEELGSPSNIDVTGHVDEMVCFEGME